MCEGKQLEQLELVEVMKSSKKNTSAKRVNIMPLKMVKDSSILYKERHVHSPQDSYNIIRTFLEDTLLTFKESCYL